MSKKIVKKGGRKTQRTPRKARQGNESFTPTVSSPDSPISNADGFLKKFKVQDLPIVPPEGSLQIEDLSPDTIHDRITVLCQDIYAQIERGELPNLHIPMRRRENILYDERNNFTYGSLTTQLALDDPYPDLLQTLRVAEIVHDLIGGKIYSTKREVFYNDVKLFKNQNNSDRAIENVATTLRTRRKCLNIIADARGVCIGRLILMDVDDIIDCERLGKGGWSISPMLDRVRIIESDAEFILVVEKAAAVIRLTEAQWWKQYPCIIITAKGQGDVSTREFVKRLVSELQIPAFGLADSDPYGLNILLTYAHGSVQGAHETPWTATNDFWWLGVQPSDLEAFSVPEDCRLPMTLHDKEKAQYMLQEEQVLRNLAVKEELEQMLQASEKAEIQALSAHGLNFLTDSYLPAKLYSGNLIHL